VPRATTTASEPEIIWRPREGTLPGTGLGRYLSWLEQHRGLRFADYASLWAWSIADLPDFWLTIWQFFGVEASGDPNPVLAGQEMPGARWFPNSRLNYARHALRGSPEDVVLVACSQTRDPVVVDRATLTEEVARVRTGLRRLGVGRGDRVAGYMPSMPEALVAFLATASLGAIWVACPPEFGLSAVVDRLGQVEPKVLLAVDGYLHGDRSVDRRQELTAFRRALPSVEQIVVVPYLRESPRVPAGAITWAQLRAEAEPLTFAEVAFDHPLWVLFSSGTTGRPKAIVHGHGGILLEHLKAVGLQYDVGSGDRLMWYSTTGWMVWNLSAGALLTGGGLVTFDGDPTKPDYRTLWRIADEHGVSHFGASPAFLAACRQRGIRPGEEFDLARLRVLIASGAPLGAEGYRWVYDAVGSDLQLAEGSGGTEVCSGFLGSSPMASVRVGEMAGRWLGVDAVAFNEHGQEVLDGPGELVVRQPMPSMPVGLWGDTTGEQYRAAYFDDFPGVWRHGDWVRFTAEGTAAITGRSDATLNRGGVRLGTAEFYACLERIAEIEDTLVVHLEGAEGGAGELWLFLSLVDGAALDEDLRARIATALRRELSPRHVPDRIVAVTVIPRNTAGKRLEVPVKRILLGAGLGVAASEGTLAVPGSLREFQRLARERDSASG
jgi:acetoacetyl-CoA synthetase